MFLNGKKGTEDIVLKAVIVIVVAVIMIFIVTAFGAKILATLFPAGDKSTVKSFDLLYNIMSVETASSMDFDMSPVTLYLTKGYCVVLFDSQVVSSNSKSGWFGSTYTYYAPDDCKGKQCICLYDGDPKENPDKKGKNVVKCSIFTFMKPTDMMNTNQTYNDLNPKICSASGERYIPLIVIGNTVGDKHYTYILNDNDANNAPGGIIEQLKVPLCPPDPTNTLCNNKKNGAIIAPDTEDGLNELRTYCADTKDDQNITHKSTSATCVYRGKDKTCQVDCSAGDVTNDCQNKYQKCDDLNQVQGIIPYISPYKDYLYYYMCKYDANFCNKGCEPNTYQLYVTKKSPSEDGTVGPEMFQSDNPDGYVLLNTTVQQECKVVWSDRLSSQGLKFLLSYDDSNQKCNDIIETYFIPGKKTVLTCKTNDISCRDLISNRKADCKIKNYSDAHYSWITYYDASVSDCDTAIKDLFGELNICAAKPQVQVVQLP